MDLDRLKSFFFAAESKTYRGAEKILGTNFTTIRKRILSLEKDLGCALFHTNDGHLNLTHEGEMFYKYANSLIQNIDGTLDLFQQEKDGHTGTLRIATTTAMANLWLVDALQSFIKANPHIKLDIRASDADLELFMHDTDVALMVVNQSLPDVIVHPLVDYEMRLVASEDYLKAHGEPKTLEDLNQHSLITYGDHVPNHYKNINWFLDKLPKNFTPAIKVNSLEGVFRMVEHDLGIGPVSQKGVRVSKKPLKAILPDLIPSYHFRVGFCYSRFREKSWKVQQLLEHLKEKFD
jgi:DNA-binding transcriptional LysR family regulator